jgi:DNA-binding transcriptional MerR regulator
MALTITEMAARLGVRSDTLRYYERTRLISSAGRTSGGYRVYDDNVVDRVRFIKAAQRSGLRLRSIAELLAISDNGNCPCGHTADSYGNESQRSTPRSTISRLSGTNSFGWARRTKHVARCRSLHGPVDSRHLRKEVKHHDLSELWLRLSLFTVLLLWPLS